MSPQLTGAGVIIGSDSQTQGLNHTAATQGYVLPACCSSLPLFSSLPSGHHAQTDKFTGLDNGVIFLSYFISCTTLTHFFLFWLSRLAMSSLQPQSVFVFCFQTQARDRVSRALSSAHKAKSETSTTTFCLLSLSEQNVTVSMFQWNTFSMKPVHLWLDIQKRITLT